MKQNYVDTIFNNTLEQSLKLDSAMSNVTTLDIRKLSEERLEVEGWGWRLAVWPWPWDSWLRFLGPYFTPCERTFSISAGICCC